MTSIKTAVVTGATSGIGDAIARALMANGYNVMLAARRVDKLATLADELGAKAAYHPTDVTKHGDMIDLVAATEAAFGQVDVLVNNAGIMPLSFFETRKVDEWDQMIDVNIKGTLYGIDAVLSQMVARQDGHIVNIASIAGLQVGPAFGVYSATKFGVRALSEGLRQEVASKNVRVTTISPGTVATELFATITDPAVLSAIQGGFAYDPMQPVSIADAVIYALSQPASVCAGEIVIRPTGQGAMG